MNKNDGDFIHTEAFEWVNRTNKAQKEEQKEDKPFMTVTINQNLGLVGYVMIGCTVLMTLISSVMGLVTIFGHLGVI